jgi:hypothetical protein
MNLQNNKKISALAIILMLSMTASLMLVPNATAHTPALEIPTFAFINVAPNPIGVNQQATVIFWLSNLYDGAYFANDYRFHNYQLTITAPDGTKETKTFANVTDSTSSQYTFYTPTQVGTYTFDFKYPGGAINDYSHDPASAYVNDTYLPSSASTTLTVQNDPIPSPISSYPLPSSYWTRPIYGENPDWWTISSNWLGTGAPGYAGFGFNSQQQSFPGDAVGPQTSHVMWTKPLQSGGIVGGNNFVIQGDTYFEGSAYNQRYTNPIILDGKLYYTEPLSFAGVSGSMSGQPYGPTDCVDLRTGELIWSRTDVPALSFGYIYDVQDINQHGVYPPILFASTGGGFMSFGSATWMAFDADTGNPMFNVTNIPTGTSVMGVNGEMLIYVLNNYGNATNPDWYLGQWNSSNLWYGQYNGPSTSPSIVPPVTDGADARMYDWNVSVPSLNTMPNPNALFGGSPLTQEYAFLNNMLIGVNGALPSAGGMLGSVASWSPYTYVALNLNPSRGAIGSILWTNTLNPPTGNVSVTQGPADPTAGVFTEAYQQTMQWVGYSMATGEKLWGPTPSQNAFDYYGTPAFPYVQGCAAYGNLYSSGFSGILYCYDMATGNLLYTYGNGGEGNSTRAGFQTAYGGYPTFINAIGNGIVYLVTTEHTITTPIYKGAMARAVNATTGEEIWTLSGYTGEFGTTSYAIADGFATWFNGYDNQIYVVGRGPSATTVQAPLTAITLGSSLMIQGTVTDISAGTTQNQQAANFPNGVPCVSDASMTDWMGYVYQQKPCPTDAAGVTVTLSVFDPNNNTYTIGTTTSDLNGLYHLMWTPQVPGEYVITATFAGTNAYWPSHAATAIGVTEIAASPQATATPTPPPTLTPTSTPTESTAPSVTTAPTPPGSSGDSTTYIAIAAAVIIVIAVAAALVLRRRK